MTESHERLTFCLPCSKSPRNEFIAKFFIERAVRAANVSPLLKLGVLMNCETMAAVSSKAVILVVEDEAIIRNLAVAVVDAAGFEAIEARNADDAIRILESRRDIRLVFTDVRMPGSMDGIILARTIRRRWPSIQLIVTSGGDDLGIKAIPERARFFLKPYRTAQVVESLRQMAA
jgi:two-component system, response regulator PdtaR